MFVQSRLALSVQAALIVTLGIWIGVLTGVLEPTNGIWLSAGILLLTVFGYAISRQSEQPKSMVQILSDLENARK
jgi:hypothetical protein